MPDYRDLAPTSFGLPQPTAEVEVNPYADLALATQGADLTAYNAPGWTWSPTERIIKSTRETGAALRDSLPSEQML